MKCMSGPSQRAVISRHAPVLAEVISACSCESNWSAHGHVHYRLAPATNEKPV